MDLEKIEGLVKIFEDLDCRLVAKRLRKLFEE